MSLEATTWALSVTTGDSTRKLILFGMANHAHKDGRNSWASKETLAEYGECSTRTVRRHILALVEGGFIREGDQAHVKHVRADRRPVVYDLAMDDGTRASWAAERAGDGPSSDAVDNPVDQGSRGDNLSPRTDGHGVTHGVTPMVERGDTAVSPELRTNLRTSPQPPGAGGDRAAAPTPTSHLAVVANCSKPGPTPHANCRGCGTTNRQVERSAAKAKADRLRAADRAASDADRARTAAGPEAAAARQAAREATRTATQAAPATTRRIR